MRQKAPPIALRWLRRPGTWLPLPPSHGHVRNHRRRDRPRRPRVPGLAHRARPQEQALRAQAEKLADAADMALAHRGRRPRVLHPARGRARAAPALGAQKLTLGLRVAQARPAPQTPLGAEELTSARSVAKELAPEGTHV